MRYDEEGLQEILRENPFVNAVNTWGEQLKQFNCGKINKSQLRFLVDDDDYRLEKCKGANQQFHFELIPDVFHGDPRAPVWILLLNPGFSEIDLYDHLGLCPFCEKRLVTALESEGEHLRECVHAWLGSGLSNPVDALRFRQETMLTQLRLVLEEVSGQYAWFDGRFRTIVPENWAKVGKGGYWWWKDFLFGTKRSNARYLFLECGINENAGDLGRKFFAIDAFPYHSKNFNCGIFRREEYRNSSYFKSWKRLVEWALGSGRKLIVRYKSVMNILKKNIDKQILEANRDSIYWMPSQMPHLTIGNISVLEQNNDASKKRALEEVRTAWSSGHL